MKKLLFLIVLIGFSSCSVLKKVDKKETDSDLKEQIISKTTRPGDTVTYFVPNIKYKDTTIYTVNRVGTRIETRYDNKGDIDRIDCYAAAIEQFTEINRQLVESIKEKKKEEDIGVDNTLIYVLGGILLIALIYVMFRLETITKVIDRR